LAFSNQQRKEFRKKNKQKLQNVIPTGTKICRQCRQEKDVEEFNRNYGNKDGLCSWCKECQSEAHKQRKENMVYTLAETKICGKCKQEKSINNFQKDGKNHDGVQSACKQCVSEYTSERYLQKQNYILQQNAEWRKNNPEQYKQIYNNYYKSNKHKLVEKLTKAKRREAMSKLPNTFTKEEWEECLEYFNHECAYCGNKEKLQRDHFVSALKGGPFTKDNVVAACSICNLRKGDKDFFEWYPKQDFYDEIREEKILNYIRRTS
jgi:5-methylcytosine-specific restriction endonuclease McrA